MRTDLKDFQKEVKVEQKEVRVELKDVQKEIKQEINKEVETVRREMNSHFQRLEMMLGFQASDDKARGGKDMQG